MQSSATQQLQKPSPSPFARNHLIRDAISDALYEAMRKDPSIYMLGEGAWVKQHYDAPRLLEAFRDRVVTLPISEDGNTNFAVGASLLGIKPVVDVIAADFLYRTLDSICNTAAKLNFVLGPGRTPSTIVIRAEFFLGGPTTGQRPEALFAHIPGLRVVIPSTPHDAYGLMQTALTTPGVTLFFEDRMIDDAMLQGGDLSYPSEPIPFGAALWRVQGQRSTALIVTYGLMRQVVEGLLRRYQFSGDRYDGNYPMLCDLLDLRSIYPVHWWLIEKLLERSGRLLIVEPDVTYGGVGAEIAAQIAERMPHVRIKRLGAPRQTIPASMALHPRMMPTEQEIEDAIRNWDWDK